MNKAIKELLSIQKEYYHKENALQGLHKVFGFDFCGDIYTATHDGNFTIKGIFKTIPEEYQNDSETVLIINGGNRWSKDYFHAVEIDKSGSYSIDFRFYNCPLDHFGRKLELEEARKSPEVHCIIISQKKSNLKKPAPKTADLESRFKLLDYSKTEYKGKTYIDNVKIMDISGNTYTYHKRPQFIFPNRQYIYTNISEIIDKSGYIMPEKRNNLQGQAGNLKASRSKAAYQNTDTATRTADLRRKAEEKRNQIAAELMQATTSEEVREIEKKVDRWNGLGEVFSKIEFLEKSDKEKSLKSMEQYERHHAEALHILAAL